MTVFIRMTTKKQNMMLKKVIIENQSRYIFFFNSVVCVWTRENSFLPLFRLQDSASAADDTQSSDRAAWRDAEVTESNARRARNRKQRDKVGPPGSHLTLKTLSGPDLTMMMIMMMMRVC